MQDLNALAIIGRMTKDLGDGFQVIGNGTAKAAFSIAVNRSVKKADQWQEEVSYFDVELMGKQAEALKPYLTKGRQLAIYGALVQNRWEKDGAKHSRVIIKADSVQLLGGNKASEDNSHAVQHQEPAEQQDFLQDGFINETIPF